MMLVSCPEEQRRKPSAPSPAWKGRKAERLKHHHSSKKQGKEATETQSMCREWGNQSIPHWNKALQEKEKGRTKKEVAFNQ